MEYLDFEEMRELLDTVTKSIKLAPLTDKVKNLLELVESDLLLRYQRATNIKSAVLTIIGLIITALVGWDTLVK